MWRKKGAYNKRGSKNTENNDRHDGRGFSLVVLLKKEKFYEIAHSCGKEKYSDIHPTGGVSKYAVIRVKKNGDEDNAYENTDKLYRPIFGVLFRKKFALDKGEK